MAGKRDAPCLPGERRSDVDDHDLYFRTRDPAARARLFARYDPLAMKVARRFRSSGRDADDIRQVARYGVLRALDRFDPGRGVRFTTFAWITAMGELKRYRRDTRWSVHVPRTLQERYLEVASTVDELPVVLGREPVAEDVAAVLDLDVVDVRECLDLRASHPASLEQRSEDGVEPSVADAHVERTEQAAELDWALSRLGSHERDVIILHYFGELTQGEIAVRIGTSQMSVCRTIARGVDRLRALLDAKVS